MESSAVSSIIERDIGSGRWGEVNSERPRIPHGATEKDTVQVGGTILFCKFYLFRILIDRANFHTKSHNIPRSFEAMYSNIKYELRAWVTCVEDHETVKRIIPLPHKTETICLLALYR